MAGDMLCLVVGAGLAKAGSLTGDEMPREMGRAWGEN